MLLDCLGLLSGLRLIVKEIMLICKVEGAKVAEVCGLGLVWWLG